MKSRFVFVMQFHILYLKIYLQNEIRLARDVFTALKEAVGRG